jgi:hypothetical protein
MKPSIAVPWVALLMSGCQLQSSSGLPTAPSPAVAQPIAPVAATPLAITGTPLRIGQTVDDRVDANAPNCFPEWDISGRCRQFDVVSDGRGVLVAALDWLPVAGDWGPDVFIVASTGTWVVSPETDPPRTVSFPAEAGSAYRIVVLSYRPAGEDFRLKTELQQ